MQPTVVNFLYSPTLRFRLFLFPEISELKCKFPDFLPRKKLKIFGFFRRPQEKCICNFWPDFSKRGYFRLEPQEIFGRIKFLKFTRDEITILRIMVII